MSLSVACIVALGAPAFQASGQEAMVQTPSGLFPASCVTEVPNGATIGYGGVVTVDGGVVAQLQDCDDQGSEVQPLTSAPGWAAWVYFDAGTVSGANHGQYTGIDTTWSVPSVPSTNSNQCSGLWTGITYDLASDAGKGLLQPLIAVDCYPYVDGGLTPTASQWYAMDYYLGLVPGLSGRQIVYTQPFAVSQSDTINAYVIPNSVYYDGALTYYLYTLEIYDESTSKGTEMVQYTGNPYFTAAWPAVFEVHGVSSCDLNPSSDITYFRDIAVYEQESGEPFNYYTDVTSSGTWWPMAVTPEPWYVASPDCNYDANAWYGDYYYGNAGRYVASLQWSSVNSPLTASCVPAFTSVDGYQELSGTTPGPNCCSGEELWNQNSTCYTQAGGSCTEPWYCMSYDCAHGYCDAGVVTAGCGSNIDCISPAKCWPPTELCLTPYSDSCTSGSDCLSGICSLGACAKSGSGSPCYTTSDCSTGNTCDNGGSTSLPGPYTTWTCI
jgi:hypothetical protein